MCIYVQYGTCSRAVETKSTKGGLAKKGFEYGMDVHKLVGFKIRLGIKAALSTFL